MAQGDPIAILQDRLRRFPPDRYPVQHGTAAFHLGCVLLDAGRVTEAAASLSMARDLFSRLPDERAKCENMLGVACRAQGQLAEAAAWFASAAATFEQAHQALERAAALFNLGLVLAQRGEAEAAIGPLEDAAALFTEAGIAAPAAAAHREHGAALLSAGRLDAAADVLGTALEMAVDTGDRAGAGAAANALGLAHLASGRTSDAVGAFRRAVALQTWSVAPAGYAMALANLALAYEHDGDPARARLAARQARAVPDAPLPVAEQVENLLGRIPPEPAPGDDLRAALDAESDTSGRMTVMRHEVRRWCMDDGAGAAGAETASLLLDTSPGVEARAEAWLSVLLEQPADEMERLLAATFSALAAAAAHDDIERARRTLDRAVNDLPEPQWLRTRAVIARLATSAGLDGWG